MSTTYNMVLNRDKILLAGPWIGEFGWELCCWQGYIRRLSKEYKKTIVVSKAGHEFLYKDFCDEFHTIDLPQKSNSDGWSCDGIDEKYLLSQISGIEYDYRLPAKNIGFSINLDGKLGVENPEFYKQDFIKFNSNIITEYVDILIHPRNRNVGSYRNWSLIEWQLLVERLLLKYSVGIIGNDEAFQIEGAKDFRNIPIEKTVALMNHSRLVVGQSSGPMHLASLCGTPHLVWSDEFNRDRYENFWNPLKTPVYFCSEMGWNPSVNFIYEKIINILN